MSMIKLEQPVVPEGPNDTTRSAKQQPLTKDDNQNFAVLRLSSTNGTFESITISVPFYPDVINIKRRTDQSIIMAPQDVHFVSTTISRRHAAIWADDNGKIWIRDTKSTNGTFVNGHRLSPENSESDQFELCKDYTLRLGKDIYDEDGTTPVHHAIIARVDHAGFLDDE
jgi:hypothetical protein